MVSRRRRSWRRLAGLVVLPVLAGWAVLAVSAAFLAAPAAPDIPPESGPAVAGDAHGPTDMTRSGAVTPAGESAPAPVAVAAVPEPVTEITVAIRRGDTASTLLAGYLKPAEIQALARACAPLFPLDRLRPGRPLTLRVSAGRLAGLCYEIDDERCLRVSFAGGEPLAALVPIPHDTVSVVVDGRIETNLYAAVAAAGERLELAVRLAEIFAWEIDFVHDLRVGDRFSVLVQKRFRDGLFFDYGPVEAAGFTVGGRTRVAVRHLSPDGETGYFTPAGENLRRAFLKAPLDFTRISSGYTARRLHPIRKVWLPHYGIDYAAPTGTPVKAVGDGTVERVTRDRHAGKYIVIRHPNGYQSYYLHLSRWARGLRSGARVRQGQVIGYVGSTGMSTGPHLDFRLKKDGLYVNPLRVESPRARRLAAGRMPEFNRRVHVCLALLPRWVVQDGGAALFAARTAP
ncbi:MAG: M23 family metallopeptidase [Deltaproteobacteria bacterium]|nr:M23 family metallopeptidase [Candidatus Anaeroferrophillacea bacterium]